MGKDNFVPLEASKIKKKQQIEYNNRTEQSYISNGLEAPETLDYQEKNFLSKVDPEAEPIQRTVTKIVRLKAIDYNSPKLERKEYIIYYENWTGRDWLKRIIPPVTDHIEGKYNEVITEPVYQQQELFGYKYSGKKEVHYIEFSKENVDSIIEKSIGSNRENIKDLFVDGPLGYEFPYDEFVNKSYEELVSMLISPGGPKTVLQKQQLERFQKQQEQQQQIIKQQKQKQ